MLALRWTLGICLALSLSGFIALCVIGNGFRRSFGASSVNLLLIAVPVSASVLLLLALIFPQHKPLLHFAAAGALVLVGLCLWQIFAEAATILWLALIYLGLWFMYYWQAAWANR